MEYSFTSWDKRRRHQRPEADRILPLVAAAGQAEMNRGQIVNAVDLDHDMLDELLTGMVSVGLLTVTAGVGGPVYRTAGGIS